MIPSSKDLVLQKKVKLYNNIAKLNDCQGRLLAELEIYPTPRLVWEFEVLGGTSGNFPHGAAWNLESINSLIGYLFLIEGLICTGGSLANIGPSDTLSGEAKQAVYGDINDSASFFRFYLPNTRFQSKRAHQNSIGRNLWDLSNNRLVGSSEEGRYGSVQIDDSWKIHLDIRKASLDWLDPKANNTGTLITTAGQLQQPDFDTSESKPLFNYKEITLHAALERIKSLCWLLSYINGGYIGPLYVEGYKVSQDNFRIPEISSAVAFSFQTTPLERLGESWFTETSDLKAWLGCFSTFERMIHKSSCRETWSFVLDQYFHAIQPSQTWPIIASAVGAAIERLSHMILIDEETDSQKKSDYELLFNIKKN